MCNGPQQILVGTHEKRDVNTRQGCHEEEAMKKMRFVCRQKEKVTEHLRQSSNKLCCHLKSCFKSALKIHEVIVCSLEMIEWTFPGRIK